MGDEILRCCGAVESKMLSSFSVAFLSPCFKMASCCRSDTMGEVLRNHKQQKSKRKSEKSQQENFKKLLTSLFFDDILVHHVDKTW